MLDKIQPSPPIQPLFGRLPQHAGKELVSYLQDQVALSKPSQATSMQVVEQLVERHLADAFPAYEPQEQAAEKLADKPDASSPERVAESIFERISGDLFESVLKANPELDEELFDEFATQVRVGVGRGLAEAKDVLESMDVFAGKIESDVTQTEQLLVDSLKVWFENTRAELFNPGLPKPADPESE